MIRRTLAVASAVAILLAGVVLWRAGRFAGRQVVPSRPDPLAIDSVGAVERLARAIRLPTVSGQDSTGGPPRALLALHALLDSAFPRVHTALRREMVGRSLLYTWPGADTSLPPLLLAGHMDVVPADSAGWSYPPFSGTVADGYIWGRGALDDKVGVLGVLEAVEALLAGGFRPGRTVYLAFGQDEEVGGAQGAGAIAALLARRGVRLEAVIDEGGAIVEGIVPGVAVPVATVGVTEKGSVSLALEARAAGGHSSMPPPRTAIGLLARAIDRLQQHQFPGSLRASRGFFDAVGPYMAWPYRVLFANLWLFEPVIVRRLEAEPSTAAAVRTTLAPTIIGGGAKDNVLPGSARAVVNLRILPGETVRSTVARVREVIADPAITVSAVGSGDDPSAVSPVGGPEFRALAAAIRQIHPDALVAPYVVLGATDARHYALLTANVYRFLPVRLAGRDLERLHGTDERIALADYLDAVRVYAQIVRNFAGSHVDVDRVSQGVHIAPATKRDLVGR
ncbi:MAG: M20/M25/M40 family metallo-hydrolase [Deltaproteobacteria bacterium]